MATIFKKSVTTKYYKTIILVFTLQMLLPSIAMVFFSDDSIVGSAAKKFFFPIFSISFILFFIAIVRPKILLILFAPIFIFSFVEIFIIANLKSPTSSGTLAAIIDTNWQEAIELLTSYRLLIIFILISLLLYVLSLIKIPYNFRLPFKFRFGLIIFFIIVQVSIIGRDVYIASQTVKDHSNLINTIEYFYEVKLNKTFPINLYFSLKQYFKGREMLETYDDKISGFTFNAKRDSVINEREVYVVVIGESARRNNFSLYGYSRKTNPFLEKLSNLICFNNTVSSANLTSMSYPQFITRATPENYNSAFKEPSILLAFKEAGFKTFYISNQKLGLGSVYSLYSRQADSIVSLNSSFDKHTTDAAVIPYFNKIINDNRNDKVLIIIHAMGSHFRYNLRYPVGFEKFSPTLTTSFSLTSLNRDSQEVLINSYDNSILFTDYFLSQLINILKQQKIVSTLLYASDHGENLFDDSKNLFGHGSSDPTKYEIEIPFIIWYSDEYQKVFDSKIKNLEGNIEKPISTINFFHTALDLSNIKIDKQLDTLSVASPFFVPLKKRGVLIPNNNVIYY